MSYARFGESDVYVFAHVHGFVECCMCSFETREVEPYTGFFGEEMTVEMGSAELHSPAEVVAHMRRHVEAGHHMPERLLDEGLYPLSDFIAPGEAREAQQAIELVQEAEAAQRILAALDAGEITVDEVLEHVEKGQNMKLAQLWGEHPRNPHDGADIFDLAFWLKEDGDAEAQAEGGYAALAEDPEYQADLAARKAGRSFVRGNDRIDRLMADPRRASAVAELEREAAENDGGEAVRGPIEPL